MSDSATILFASPAPGNASMMTDFLADNGFRSVAATSLDEFDEAIVEDGIDLALVDADGFPAEVWERCETVQKGDIPLFVISQHRTAVQEKGREHQVTGVFEKPLGQDALLETIEQLLGQ